MLAMGIEIRRTKQLAIRLRRPFRSAHMLLSRIMRGEVSASRLRPPPGTSTSTSSATQSAGSIRCASATTVWARVGGGAGAAAGDGRRRPRHARPDRRRRATHELPLEVLLFLALTVATALVGGLLPAIVCAVLASLASNTGTLPRSSRNSRLRPEKLF